MIADRVHLLDLYMEKAIEDGVFPSAAWGLGKSRAAELANIAKNLLYLGHLLRRAETAVLDEYYVSKGFDVPQDDAERRSG